MKKTHGSPNNSRIKKVACTVSAAALMLGVSSAATIGLHFQENYCGAPAYSGYPVTQTAFGIDPSAWENLAEMNTGYGSCSGPLGYTTNEVIDMDTSTNGLNPLPNGSLSVTWFGPTANFDPFYGYAGSPPHYTGGGPLNRTTATGEQEVYATFIRDGINFGPPGGANNDQPGYWVDITGLKSLFTNTPFVVELIASSDSMETLTNALVIDVTNSITNIVSYPGTPPVGDAGDAPWVRGTGGGLSTGSGAFTNIDHLYITSVQPQHGGFKTNGTGFNHAGNICGFIITDKPVVSMSPQSIPTAGAGDTISLSAYAIGVPPLSYQWRFNGQSIAGATTTNYTITNLNFANGGNYDLVVTNLYGAATSKVSTVFPGITHSATSGIVYDSNPVNTQNDGVNMGATWMASNSDGAITRTGVMSFVDTNTNGITVADNTNFDGPTGTITLWMQSAGTDSSSSGSFGASLFCRPAPGANGASKDFILLQQDSGSLNFQTSDSVNVLNSSKNVSDSKWHFVAVTFDQSTNGGAAVYIDGTLDTTNANPGSWTWPLGQPIEIGYTTDTYWKDYNGLLDDVRYYSAVLTPSQIAAVQTGAPADPNDLQMQFNFTDSPGQGIVLTWQLGAAVLQTAPTVAGPWVDQPGANSPYTIVPAATQQYFRYRFTHTPQSVVSNPYLM